jgi:hypothetical protein
MGPVSAPHRVVGETHLVSGERVPVHAPPEQSTLPGPVPHPGLDAAEVEHGHPLIGVRCHAATLTAPGRGVIRIACSMTGPTSECRRCTRCHHPPRIDCEQPSTSTIRAVRDVRRSAAGRRRSRR